MQCRIISLKVANIWNILFYHYTNKYTEKTPRFIAKYLWEIAVQVPSKMNEKKQQILWVCYFNNILCKINVQITRTIVLKFQAYLFSHNCLFVCLLHNPCDRHSWRNIKYVFTDNTTPQTGTFWSSSGMQASLLYLKTEEFLLCLRIQAYL